MKLREWKCLKCGQFLWSSVSPIDAEDCICPWDFCGDGSIAVTGRIVTIPDSKIKDTP